MTLGTKLRNLRTKKNISLDKMAQELELSKTSINNWESDKVKPSLDNLSKLCNYYTIDLYDLMDEVENVSFKITKFKGSSYVFTKNSTINFNNSPEIIQSIIENQQNISKSILLQNELIQSLLDKK